MKRTPTYRVGRSWVDIARQYGGRSNSIGDVEESRPEWNKHRCFKLRMKKYAFDHSGHVWVTNNYQFIPLRPKSVWRWAKRRSYRINWPQYVLSLDGKTFGNVEYGTYDLALNAILIEWWDVERGGGYGKERAASRWTPALVFKQKLTDADTRRFMK